MALELIGSLLVAAVFGLMAWAFRRWVPSAPKWLISVSAGVGLIGTTVWLEYDWFNRVSAALPPGFVVVHAEATSTPMRVPSGAVPKPSLPGSRSWRDMGTPVLAGSGERFTRARGALA